jgi:hypothetical protein
VRGWGRSPREAWQRRVAAWLHQQVELAESTQAGLAAGADEAADSGPVPAALAEFRESIAVLLRTLPEAAASGG